MDNCGGVGLEQQKAAVYSLGAVNRVIVQLQPLMYRFERGGVPAGETFVEVGHGSGFFRPLFRGLGHARVQVVHHPTARNPHVAEKRLLVDKGDRADLRYSPSGAGVVLSNEPSGKSGCSRG